MGLFNFRNPRYLRLLLYNAFLLRQSYYDDLTYGKNPSGVNGTLDEFHKWGCLDERGALTGKGIYDKIHNSKGVD